MVVVGRKRENRERRGDQYFVCACVRALPAHNMVVGTRVRVRERKGKKKSSWRRNDDGRRSRWQPRRGAMSSLVWRLRLETARGVWCVRCAVCHIQCATFAQNYLLSLLSPNNFSLLIISLLTNSMLYTHTHSLPSHVTLTASPATSPACLPAYLPTSYNRGHTLSCPVLSSTSSCTLPYLT